MARAGGFPCQAAPGYAGLGLPAQKALSLFEKGPLGLVAGEGFEPSTSGL